MPNKSNNNIEEGVSHWDNPTDPTSMTTLQLRFTEKGLRNEIQALNDILQARLDGMEEATKIQLLNLANYPIDIKDAVDQVRSLHNQDISAIEALLQERNERFKEVNEATDKALDLAAKLTEKQLDSLRLTMVSDKANMDKDVGAVTSRLDRIEAVALGLDKASDSSRQMTTLMLSGLGVLLVAIGIIVSIIATRVT